MNENEIDLLDRVAVPAFVLSVDDAGEPIYEAFNRTAQAASGLSLDDVIGKTAKEIYAGRFGENAYLRHIETIATAMPITYELTLPLAGSLRRVRTTLDPMLDGDGYVVRLVGTSADITTEQLIREAQTNAETITSETEQFVSMAAHDLRSPMRRISSLAEDLRKNFHDLGDDKLELINKLEQVATKTIALTSDILAHTNIANAKPRIGLFDFESLCADILVTLDPMRQHRVTYDSGQIEGDSTATQIVIRNLIDNAFKHGGRDSLTLAITLSTAEDGMFQVSIRDDGRGFDDPTMAFEDKETFRHEGGFGLLGARRLILARGGKITARTPKDGPGAIVEFTLPGQVVD